MFIKKRSNSSGGFSLMELLMVMVITPVIFFAVYANFSTGARLWLRMVQTVPDEDLSIFYVKVGRDLRGMMRFESIPLEGTKEEVSFPAAIEAAGLLGGDRGIGQVHLYYDEDSRTIRRQVKDYSAIFREKEGVSSALLQGVTSFELSYLTTDPLEKEPFWAESWSPEPGKLPLAVKMVFSMEGEPGIREKTEFIPAGGLIKK